MAFFELIDYCTEQPLYFLTAVLLTGIFTYVLSQFVYAQRAGPNPFSISHVRPPPAIVTDRTARKKVLKQKFKAEEVPENVDDVIIGSGIGALTTAVLLGRAGHKVLVLEQHDQAGGNCHTFEDKGFEFDTGIHYVGKHSEGTMDRILTDQITEGQVDWHAMDEVFDKVALGPSNKARWYTMVSGSKEKFTDNLKRQFPKLGSTIDKLMSMIQQSYDSFIFGVIIPKILPKFLCRILIKTGIFHILNRKFMGFCRTPIKQALDDLTDDEEFKAVMSYIFGDMGTAPSEMGVVAYAQLMMHFMPGSYYPVGGTSEIAFQIIPIIERQGGRVFTKAPVSRILLDTTGKAVGVRVMCKTGDVDVYGSRVISSAGIKNTFNQLLPREVAAKSAMPVLADMIGPSTSYLSVFVGMDGTTEELGLNAGNTWAFTGHDLDKLLSDYTSLTLEQAAETECPLMFVSFSSAKDPAWQERHPGKSVAIIISLVPYHWFQAWEYKKVNHRGEDYDQLKKRIGYQMLTQMEELFPSTAGKAVYVDVGTPVTNRYYLGQPEGEMYGIDHNTKRFWPEVSMNLRAETNIPGLYLTGQDILTCGFSGAMNAGVMTASAILNRQLYHDLFALTRQVQANIKKQKK